MSAFWRSWMTVWCCAVVVFGVVLLGAAFEATSGPARMLFAILDGPGEPGFDAHLRFSVGLMGAVTLGWGLTLFATVNAAHDLAERAAPVWRMLTASVIAWYVIDCTISIATGFALNAASNTLLMLGYLAPVLMTGVLRARHSRVRA